MSYVIDSYTKLLIPFNGTDGDTNDQTALTGQTVSLEGNAQLDTEYKKLGTASLLLDGSGDYASVPDSDDWHFGTDPFTLDLFARFTSISNDTRVLFSQYGSDYWRVTYNETQHLFRIYSYVSGGAVIDVYGSYVVSADTFYHLEFSRASESQFYIFVNGSPLSLTTNLSGSKSMASNTGDLLIGIYNPSSLSYPFHGNLDMPRVRKGICAHTTNFTPPNEANFFEVF